PVVTSSPRPHAEGGPGDRRRRRRRALDGRFLPRRAPSAPVVPVRGPEAPRAEREGESEGPPDRGRADRCRQGHPTHRQDVPADRGAAGHPVSRAGAPTRQDRHHGLRLEGTTGFEPTTPTYSTPPVRASS